MRTSSEQELLRYDGAGLSAASRVVPVETAVAISYNGASQAVMMATPADLEDFARGFTLTEAIASPGEIETIEVVPRGTALELAIWLRPEAAARLSERRRSMAGPVGCGLCGLESLEEALRPPPRIGADLVLGTDEIIRAAASLRAHQPLQDETRAVHAAAFWQAGAGVLAAREDVGRHNALDKLAGALLVRGSDPATGAVVLTSRLSLDMVQKVARLGAPVVVAVSAPTSAALELAREAGITVVAAARGGTFEIFTHPHRIRSDAAMQPSRSAEPEICHDL